ncbi:MAG: hypothetical protein H6607_07300 [Flavobacteriales bacterium]|nr:hypothetical protein [Flavobacteriales bacterium]
MSHGIKPARIWLNNQFYLASIMAANRGGNNKVKDSSNKYEKQKTTRLRLVLE